jgi:hypothetical protein
MFAADIRPYSSYIEIRTMRGDGRQAARARPLRPGVRIAF